MLKRSPVKAPMQRNLCFTGSHKFVEVFFDRGRNCDLALAVGSYIQAFTRLRINPMLAIPLNSSGNYSDVSVSFILADEPFFDSHFDDLAEAVIDRKEFSRGLGQAFKILQESHVVMSEFHPYRKRGC